MKKLIFTTLLISTAAVAQAQEILDHYRTVTRRVPNTQLVCQQVSVPVYGHTSEPGPGGMILGAIVGNAIGRAAGVSGGQTAGTIIGGIAGNEISRGQQRARVTEYRTEERCTNQTTYSIVSEEVYSHSTITFTDRDGRRRIARFNR